MPRRPDAELVKTSKFRELEFHIMHRRNESAIYAEMLIDLSKTFDFLKQYNNDRKEDEKITLFHVILTACVRTITLRPKINRFVSGRRLWQRNQIIMSFVVNKEKTEESEEVNAMIEFDPYDTLDKVQKNVDQHIYAARHQENPNEKDIKFFGGLPRWLIRFIFWFARWLDEHNMPIYSITKDMPLWSSAFLAQLGSIGVDAVYHHPFDLGTASIILVIGKVHKARLLNQLTEEVETKKVLKIKACIDDRIAGGIYTGPTFDLLKNLIENPEKLVKPPQLTTEQLDALKLKKYKKERLQREKQKKREQRRKKKEQRRKKRR